MSVPEPVIRIQDYESGLRSTNLVIKAGVLKGGTHLLLVKLDQAEAKQVYFSLLVN